MEQSITKGGGSHFMELNYIVMLLILITLNEVIKNIQK